MKQAPSGNEITDKIRWDSLKAALFGKFYEAFLVNYFKEVLGFETHCQEISILSKWIEIRGKKRRIKALCHNKNIDEKIMEGLLKRYQKGHKELENRKRYNPDLAVQKNGKYYVVEAEIWPVWLERQQYTRKLTWKVVSRENLGIMPEVFAQKVKIGSKEYPVSGFYYVSFERSEEHESIEEFFREISGREFEIFYMDEILEKIKNYEWFKNIVRKVEEEVKDFLESLEKGVLKFESTTKKTG
ncbi:MAG: hypothetical protein QW566_02185 [Candidatus Jordarchaeales archaeon]